MTISESLMRRATDVARLMSAEGHTTLPIALYEGEEPRQDGLISTSQEAIAIIIGSFDLDGTTYYLGLPKNGS